MPPDVNSRTGADFLKQPERRSPLSPRDELTAQSTNSRSFSQVSSYNGCLGQKKSASSDSSLFLHVVSQRCCGAARERNQQKEVLDRKWQWCQFML
ncbi:hypothetical protein AOLI_G00251330 [Acnodon oligacanthus]